MHKPGAYDRHDIVRATAEEHSALRTVSRWLQTILQESDAEASKLARLEVLRGFLDTLRSELTAHFQREETEGGRCWGKDLEGFNERFHDEHVAILAALEELYAEMMSTNGHGDAHVVEHLHELMSMLERHEAAERQVFGEDED